MNPICLPVLLKDGYKVGHKFQYPKDTTLIYSNMTPRKSRIPGVGYVVSFGLQYFILEYLHRQFGEGFFQLRRSDVEREYKRRIDGYLGPGIPTDHISALHELGYLPLVIKAIPEGRLVPVRVPWITFRNTISEFSWLTNMLETLESNILWGASTSATTAFLYRKRFEEWAQKTGADPAFIPWQGHDFSMRGMFGIEAACVSGAGHLLSFTGTDTIPAIDFLEQYYYASGLIGGSVPATEHSVMSMGKKDGELETIRRLITEVYPTGIVSIVCDTWDFWKVITEYLPALRDVIMARDGKVVVRPDSGDPVKVICGEGVPDWPKDTREWAIKHGAIESLWKIFGGTTTSTGHRVLDSHIGLIYGDSITPERQDQILRGLAEKNFASSNVVLGIGSYTYQHVTRDTYGFAMKATYGETKSGGGQEIYKDPVTDDGTKKSHTGLLRVDKDENGWLTCAERVNWEEEAKGELREVFRDGAHVSVVTLQRVRNNIAESLKLVQEREQRNAVDSHA
jgi:nicotinamide phosphoribosyltransferase